MFYYSSNLGFVEFDMCLYLKADRIFDTRKFWIRASNKHTIPYLFKPAGGPYLFTLHKYFNYRNGRSNIKTKEINTAENASSIWGS